jgi:Ca2+-transporting ATPase
VTDEPNREAPVGLTSAVAAERLAAEGFNELPSSKPRRFWHIALDVFREPMFLLLVACGAIYLMLGDRQEALILLGFVFIVAVISLYQEHKTERALEALRDLTSPRALVIRDGKQLRIAGREVVRGDLMVLAEGDRVPADAALRTCINLSTDESLVSGESVPVRKAAWDGVQPICRPGGDDLPFVFAGTLVTHGRSVAEVLAIGVATEIGRIGKALEQRVPEPTRVQRETARVVRRIAIAGAALSLLVAVVYASTRDDWLNGLLVGVTTAMALLPEELPVVLTIFLSLGAWRIGQTPRADPACARTRDARRRHGAVRGQDGHAHDQPDAHGGGLCRRPLGGACRTRSGGPGRVRAPTRRVRGARQPARSGRSDGACDPRRRARGARDTEHLHADWTLVEEYPLSRALLAMSRVWRSPDAERYVVAAKGAPEAIVDLCHLEPDAGRPCSRRPARWRRAGCVCWALRGPASTLARCPITSIGSRSNCWA